MVRVTIKAATGLSIGQFSKKDSKAGMSNNGNTARRFFASVADIVLACVADKYKEIVRELHQRMSVIVRVISCTRKVDTIKFDSLVNRTNLVIATKLPWVLINWTLHGVLHHSVQLIEWNGGWSIGALSEEPLEENNKFIRRFLNQFSRTSSPIIKMS